MAALGLAVPALAATAGLGMLDQLDSGRWEIRVRGEGGTPERMCIDTGRRLIQLRHPGDQCERFVIEDGPGAVTVQYTCKGRGYGRTQIRKESPRLVQIDSQGIANGLPFQFSAEARRVGDCGG